MTTTSQVLAVICALPALAQAEPVDCSEAYGKTMRCERVACDALYQSFIGVWKGPFRAYVKELSKDGKTVFRPYENATSYVAADCLKNPGTGETFIIGRMTDTYPAFSGLPARTDHSLLVTGRNSDGSPFLRIAGDTKTVSTYHLDYRNEAASLAIWSMTVPPHDHAPEMEYTTIDGRDFTDPSVDRRNVTITLRVGPKDHPFFSGVVGAGSHTRH
jgi:hypothetical protein